jgi:hypothetical protein
MSDKEGRLDRERLHGAKEATKNGERPANFSNGAEKKFTGAGEHSKLIFNMVVR